MGNCMPSSKPWNMRRSQKANDVTLSENEMKMPFPSSGVSLLGFSIPRGNCCHSSRKPMVHRRWQLRLGSTAPVSCHGTGSGALAKSQGQGTPASGQVNWESFIESVQTSSSSS